MNLTMKPYQSASIHIIALRSNDVIATSTYGLHSSDTYGKANSGSNAWAPSRRIDSEEE